MGFQPNILMSLKDELLENKSKIVSVGLDRGGDYSLTFVEVSEDGKIGFSLDNNFNLSVEEFSFLESFPAGYRLAMTRLGVY